MKIVRASALCVPAAMLAPAMGAPNVETRDLLTVQLWGTIGDVTGYSIGTVSCNRGTTPLAWEGSTNMHPVISATIFRLEQVDGHTRFEQLGTTWVKHGFCALADGCFNCEPVGTGCQQALGVGCADPYFAATNGWQTNLGPRTDINPWTGQFPYPYTIAYDEDGNRIYKRLQVLKNDMDPALHPGARYFAEGTYVHPEDAAAGHQMDNTSYAAMTVGTETANGFPLTMDLQTEVGSPAILAWRDHGLGPGVPDPLVEVVTADVIGMGGIQTDGRFYIGSRVSDNGDGTWRYEYAVYNMNSDRGAGSFSVPVAPGVSCTNPGFRDVHDHSGSPSSTVDWTHLRTADALMWSTDSFVTDANANAVRWQMLFNFRFDADAGPADGELTIGLFKPGGPGDPTVLTVPARVPAAPAGCGGDINGDGVVNGADLSVLIGSFGAVVAPGTSGDINGDGVVNGADLSVVIGSFGCEADA